MKRFAEEILKNICEEIFEKIGLPKKDAQECRRVLIDADKKGINSHGVARLKGYLALWEKKRINPTPKMKVVRESISTAIIDADQAMGMVSSEYAMGIAIKKAQSAGSGWVTVRNSNHFGIAGYHASKALEKDMIGISMTNASPLASPPNASAKMLGTNPICYAIPAGEEPPFVGDMATTAVSNGKLEMADREKKPIPSGWANDQNGNPSNNPKILSKGGSLLPLGSSETLSQHKGFILGGIVDIMSGVLSGAGFSLWTPPFVSFLNPRTDAPGKGLGHFFGVINVEAFRDTQEFKQDMDTWIRSFRAVKTFDQKQVIIPGDIERETKSENEKRGIPLNENVIKDLQTLIEKYKTKTQIAIPF